MAENDIYNSKKQYGTIVKKIEKGIYLKPEKGLIYYIKNPRNLKYFKQLLKEFNYKDISYIRRIQIFKALRITCYFTNKDLKDVTRDDVKNIVAKTNKILTTINTRRCYVDYNKHVWKIILPEKDDKDRPDDSITPYPWRIKVHSDISLKKDKADKFTDTEYLKIMKALSNDPRMQLWFSMIYCNLARPQELCFIDLDNVELFDNYARVRISQHGKEGTKTLQLIDNYYYLVQWLNKHPFWHAEDKNNKPLFITMGNNSMYGRLSPKHANKILKNKLRELGINKPITNYSFKRNGVTVKILSGNSPQDIQKTAGWTSTDQLKTYDISTQEEFLEKELISKGVMKPTDKQKKKLVTYKLCSFCNEINPISNDICNKCNRPLNRDDILKAESEKDKQLEDMQKKLEEMTKKFELLDKFEEFLNKQKPTKATVSTK